MCGSHLLAHGHTAHGHAKRSRMNRSSSRRSDEPPHYVTAVLREEAFGTVVVCERGQDTTICLASYFWNLIKYYYIGYARESGNWNN